MKVRTGAGHGPQGRTPLGEARTHWFVVGISLSRPAKHLRAGRPRSAPLPHGDRHGSAGVDPDGGHGPTAPCSGPMVTAGRARHRRDDASPRPPTLYRHRSSPKAQVRCVNRMYVPSARQRETLVLVLRCSAGRRDVRSRQAPCHWWPSRSRDRPREPAHPSARRVGQVATRTVPTMTCRTGPEPGWSVATPKSWRTFPRSPPQPAPPAVDLRRRPRPGAATRKALAPHQRGRPGPHGPACRVILVYRIDAM